jgi:hypothetical protein
MTRLASVLRAYLRKKPSMNELRAWFLAFALATSNALEAYRGNLRMFDALMRMSEAMAAFRPGTVIVAAAGNESRTNENPEYKIGASLPAAAVLRRGVLPAQADLRPLVVDALAPADGGGATGCADQGEPFGRHAHRRGEARRLLQVIVDTTVQPKVVAFPAP